MRCKNNFSLNKFGADNSKLFFLLKPLVGAAKLFSGKFKLSIDDAFIMEKLPVISDF